MSAPICLHPEKVPAKKSFFCTGIDRTSNWSMQLEVFANYLCCLASMPLALRVPFKVYLWWSSKWQHKFLAKKFDADGNWQGSSILLIFVFGNFPWGKVISPRSVPSRHVYRPFYLFWPNSQQNSTFRVIVFHVDRTDLFDISQNNLQVCENLCDIWSPKTLFFLCPFFFMTHV